MLRNERSTGRSSQYRDGNLIGGREAVKARWTDCKAALNREGPENTVPINEPLEVNDRTIHSISHLHCKYRTWVLIGWKKNKTTSTLPKSTASSSA